MPALGDASFCPRNKGDGESCLLNVLWEALRSGKLCRATLLFLSFVQWRTAKLLLFPFPTDVRQPHRCEDSRRVK